MDLDLLEFWVFERINQKVWPAVRHWYVLIEEKDNIKDEFCD